MIYYREGGSFPSATGQIWAGFTHEASIVPRMHYCPRSSVAGHMDHCPPGCSPYLTTNYPDLSSPAPPRAQTIVLEPSSSRGQNWYHVTQRPITCQLIRLSSGQSPRQTRTFLSARIFFGPRDHILAAKSKEQEDSSLYTKVLEWRVFCLIPILFVYLEVPILHTFWKWWYWSALSYLYQISLLSYRYLKMAFAYVFHVWISTWSTNNIQMSV